MSSEGLYEFHDGSASVAMDTRSLPMLLATWSGTTSLALIQSYFETHQRVIEELDAAGERCILLTRTEKAGRPPADVRRFIAKRTAELRPLLSRVIVASAMVVTNPLVRGAMTALGWVNTDLRIPMLPSLGEGYAWARGALDEHGLEIPERIAHVRSA